MTTLATVPVYLNERIHNLPEDLANAVSLTRQNLDSMESDEDEDEDEDEEEDEDAAFFDRMKKAKKAKKDSIEEAIEHIDAIEAENDDLKAENEVLVAKIKEQYHGDADDEEMTVQELAKQFASGFELARPYLPADASIDDYSDVFDIYQEAIESQYPEADIDFDDEAEILGAFNMMIAIRNPRQQQPSVSVMDSDESIDLATADRSFSEALGGRLDSTPVMPKAVDLKPLY